MTVLVELSDLRPQLTFVVKNYFYQMGGLLLIIDDNQEIFYPYHHILRVKVVKGKKD